MNTTTANSVINRLNSLFGIYGFQNSMLTVNGPQWNSTDTKLFFEARGIKQGYYSIMANSQWSYKTIYADHQ